MTKHPLLVFYTLDLLSLFRLSPDCSVIEVVSVGVTVAPPFLMLCHGRTRPDEP